MFYGSSNKESSRACDETKWKNDKHKPPIAELPPMTSFSMIIPNYS